MLSFLKSNIAKNFLDAGSFAFIQFCLSTIRGIILARLITPDLYGAFFLILTIANFAFTIINLGSSAGFIRFSNFFFRKKEEKEKLQAFFSFYLYLSLIWVIVLFLVGNLFEVESIFPSNFVANYYNTTLLIIFFVGSLKIENSIYWSFENFRLRGITLILPLLIQNLFFLYFFFFTQDLAVGPIYILLFSYSLSFIISSLLLWIYYKISLFHFNLYASLKSSDFKEFCKFSLWAMGSALAMQGFGLFDKAFLESYLGLGVLGKYFILFNIFNYFYKPFEIFSNVLLAFYQKKFDKNEAVEKDLEKYLYISLATITVIAGIFILFENYIISMIYGNKYILKENNVTYLLYTGLLARIVYSFYGIFGSIYKVPQYITYSIIPSILMYIVLLIISIKYYGVIGAPFSFTVAYLSIVTFVFFYFKKSGVNISFKPIGIVLCLTGLIMSYLSF